METFAPTFVYRHARLRIATERPAEFVDLTDGLELLVAEAAVSVGLMAVQSLHTTTGIVVNEHEPQLLADFTALLESIAPRSGSYRHDTAGLRTVNIGPEERPNGHAHCQALLLGSSACLNVVDGRLLLGRWQRVFLVELDGPQTREIAVTVIGESRP